MSILRLALRNTRRHSRRTLLTGLAIGIAVAAVTFMDAYLEGAMTSMFEGFIQLEAGHIKVVPVEAKDRSRPLSLDKGIKGLSSLLETMETTPGVTDIAPRIRFPVLLESKGNSIPAFGLGLSFNSEDNLMNPAKILAEGRLPEDGSWDLMLGNQLAEKLGLKIGDELFMVTTDSYGGLGPGLYKICGIAHTGIGYIDRKTFYVPLSAAQEQLGMDDSVMEIACRIDSGTEGAIPVAELMNDLLKKSGRDDIVALPWQEQGMLYEMMGMAKAYGPILMLLLGVIALTTVVNTVLMSVMERVREIGALRAIGFQRGTVVKMILSESMLIGIVGTAAGIILGMSVAIWLNHVGIDFSSAMESVDFPMKPIIYPDPSLMTAVKSGIFGLVVALVAAWYPARVAARLEPVEALRAN